MFTKVLTRPALAIVISILLLFLGVLGIKTLPIAQFPDVAPPTVYVSIAYPGASANVLVDSVLIPLEQSINGVQNMRYIVSDATSAGEATIRIFFEPGTDPEHQRRERAEPGQHHAEPAPAAGGARGHPRQPGRAEHADVPEHLQHGPERRSEGPVQLRQRLRHARAQADPGHGHPGQPRQPHVRDAHLAESRAHARLQRLRRGRHEGPGGAEHHRLARPARSGHGHDLAVERVRADLRRALQQAGAVREHHPEGQCRRRDPAAQGRLRPPTAARRVEGAARRHRGSPHGATQRPASGIELGSEFFDIYSDIDGHPAASIVLKQAPGSNAAEVIEEIKEKLEEIKKESFPPGMDYEIRLRRLQVRGRLHREGAAHPARGVHPGVAGGLHVPR